MLKKEEKTSASIVGNHMLFLAHASMKKDQYFCEFMKHTFE